MSSAPASTAAQLTSALPAGILPASAAAARDTLGGALAVAGQLPVQPGQALVQAARQAFTSGLHVAFAVSAAVVLGAAVLAAIQLRHLRPAPEPDGAEPDAPEPDAPEPDASGPDGRESHVA